MKKILLFCFIFVLTFILVGCNNDKKDNEEIFQEIKTSYIKNFCNGDTNVDEITIEEYYGCYNDYHTVLIKELNKGDNGKETEVVIENLTFTYPFSNREILLFKDGKFITLVKGYENKLIKLDDLINIHKIFISD